MLVFSRYIVFYYILFFCNVSSVTLEIRGGVQTLGRYQNVPGIGLEPDTTDLRVGTQCAQREGEAGCRECHNVESYHWYFFTFKLSRINHQHFHLICTRQRDTLETCGRAREDWWKDVSHVTVSRQSFNS